MYYGGDIGPKAVWSVIKQILRVLLSLAVLVFAIYALVDWRKRKNRYSKECTTDDY